MPGDQVTLFLCGDVMLGRGVDQILPHPGDPALREGYVRDARTYVRLAAEENGPMPWPADFTWPWGDALPALEAAAPDVRVVNLETSVTRCDTFAPAKGIHYRMHPDNLPALTVVRPDVCVLANNHVLDFGRRGLEETLHTLAEAGLRVAGAGRDAEQARRPTAVPVAGGGRVLVLAFGVPSSGIPHTWAATDERPGVHVVPELTTAAATALADRLRAVRRPGDLAVASVHWGSNWGYEIPRTQIHFAHTLVDAGVDLVHGHSSHHPRPMEVYRGKLVLYGCGDFIDDYEGISGYARYRDDLRLAYLAALSPETGRLTALRMVPLQAHRLRLRYATPEDTTWLRTTLNHVSSDFGTVVAPGPDGTLVLSHAEPGPPAG
ncbi:CapA family protein [Streptomyces sp. LX-29]|uniref:CapA family protein n=1 Tax=Streptomyces sp. LX-29 TaxID=2900152 RepID=UPI00240DA73C|nr:CapA family protein [Streptomyces sp. LX-29]WFB06141.1 CapA family protein [Streptomyces sp. LX-29]